MSSQSTFKRYSNRAKKLGLWMESLFLEKFTEKEIDFEDEIWYNTFTKRIHLEEVATMVVLTEFEKEAMCRELSDKLPKIRSLLSLTQSELGYLCGFSRIRVSQIETGKTPMSWSQLTSIMLVCEMNQKTKEYIYANGILGPRFLQFMQRKDENIPPDINVEVRPEVVSSAYRQITR